MSQAKHAASLPTNLDALAQVGHVCSRADEVLKKKSEGASLGGLLDLSGLLSLSNKVDSLLIFYNIFFYYFFIYLVFLKIFI